MLTADYADEELLDEEFDWRALGKWAVGPAVSFGVAGGARALGKKAPWWLAPSAGAVASGLANILFADEEDQADFMESEAAPAIIAQMEQLGAMAEQAESQREADEFLASLIPLAARLVPKAASLVGRFAPQLIRGATQIGRMLRRDPSTRRLVRAVPTMVRQATTQLARQAGRGLPPTPRRASTALARQARRTLHDRRRLLIALRRSQQLIRQLAMQNRALRMQLLRRRRGA
jgi:hypothetical protein